MSSVDKNLIDELINFRKVLHQTLELVFDVANPSKLITNELREAGLEVSN